MPRQEATLITSLPDDILFIIIKHLEVQDIGRLACLCKRFSQLCKRSTVWLAVKKRLTIVKGCVPRKHQLTVEDECRVATFWMLGKYKDDLLIRHRHNQLPWMQRDDNFVWISQDNRICCYQTSDEGGLHLLKRLEGHTQDVSRFRTDGKLVVSGGSDKSICIFDCHSGERLYRRLGSHAGDVQDLDFKNELIVSGSRDATIKVWSMEDLANPKWIFNTGDRVWSVALSPMGNVVAAGTSGTHEVAPLRLWDLESGTCTSLDVNFRHGAGVLNMYYESAFVIYSCGYDTCVRLWDLRTSPAKCVQQWEEPFDSTIYCLRRDSTYNLVTGTARHGLVQLWDTRYTTHPIQCYYSGRTSSPVYSLIPEANHLFVALDKGIHRLNFNH